jgi:hypothetical protein
MHRIFAVLTCVTIVSAVFFGDTRTGASLPLPQSISTTAHASATDEATDAHAGGCATGCAVANHPVDPLTESDYRYLLDELANGDAAASVQALEKLLFHGNDARGFVGSVGTEALDEAQADMLGRELAKTHVRLWFRLVDARGVARAEIAGERFPVGVRTHMEVTATHDLPLPEISGTIHRTGVNHLWVRM